MFTTFRKDVRKLHPFILPTIASISIYNFGWGFADPYFSVYLSTFASHYTVIGFLNTLYVVLAVFMLIPLSRLLSTTNHHAINAAAKVGYSLCAALYFAAGYYASMPLLIAALLWNGVVISLVWTTTAATLRQFSKPSNASFVFGLYYTCRNLSWAIGALIILFAIQYIPIYWIFVPIMIFPLASLLPTLHLAPTHTKSLWKGVRALHYSRMFSDFVTDVRTFPRELWWMYIIYFLSYGIQIFWWTFIPLYGNVIGFSLSEVGMIVVVLTLPFAFSFIAAEISDRSERLRNIMVGLFVSGLSIALLAVVPHTLATLMVLGFASMMGYAIALPSLSAVVTLTSPKKAQSSATVFLDLMMFIAIIALSPLFGRMIDVFGWLSAFLLIGTALVMLGLWVFVLKLYWHETNTLYQLNHPKSRKLPYII